MATQPVQIVWYKRDLRISDQRPLAEAAQRGPVLPLYIVEPSLLTAPDYASRHWTFTRRCLAALREDLAALGQPLVVRVGEAVPTLAALCRQFTIGGVWAHEETGNGRTFERDKAVRRFLREQSIPFAELPHNGVVRGLKNRNHWETARNRRLRQPLAAVPPAIQPVNIHPGRIPDHRQLRLLPDRHQDNTPAGGTAVARELLASFLQDRGQDYVQGMSSPLTAPDVCSRLSPHLALGTISTRQVLHQLQQPGIAIPPGAVRAFTSRLAWRDHFIQKLEMEPTIEFESFVRAFDSIRGYDHDLVMAWAEGRTGFPFVDACMRQLRTTGWINFRMRAMLVSFVSFDLWQHWREPALHLARLFVDYEPGIHYSQMQMQSGTTGNRTVRFYNPVRQGQRFDPTGAYIRRWVPELAGVRGPFIHEPWRLSPAEQGEMACVLGRDYPRPLVDHEAAVRKAKANLALVRNDPIVQQEIALVRKKHGSRRQKADNDRRPGAKTTSKQLRLF